MDAGELALVKAVVGIFLGERDQDGACLLGIAVAQSGHGEHHAGKGAR